MPDVYELGNLMQQLDSLHSTWLSDCSSMSDDNSPKERTNLVTMKLGSSWFNAAYGLLRKAPCRLIASMDGFKLVAVTLFAPISASRGVVARVH